jgi:hypothetical protein
MNRNFQVNDRVFVFRATMTGEGVIRSAVRYAHIIQLTRLEDGTQIVTVEAEDEFDENGNARRFTYPAAFLTYETQ